MPSIGVVIPTYNRVATTMAAVRSALAQTLPVDEIVVVDDCSTETVDASVFENLDPRVVFCRNETNRGAAATRQAGVDRSTADIVAMLDSDDLWSATKLERQLPLLLGAKDDMVAVSCGWTEVDENGTLKRTRIPIEASEPLAFASGCWFCPGTTIVIPKKAFATTGPFDARLRRLEDLDWFLRFALAGGSLRVLRSYEAQITIGTRARPGPVRSACDMIMQKAHSLHDIPHRAALIRQLEAWLSVELARAAWNERDALSTLRFLLRSLRLVPRTRLQLYAWWNEALDSGRPAM